MSSVAEEVKNPGNAYLNATLGLLILDVIFINFLPLFLSLSVDPVRSHYDAGHFALIAGDLAGSWLTILLTITAQISQIGLYICGSIACDRYFSILLFPPKEELLSVFHSILPLQNDFLFGRDGSGVCKFIIFANAGLTLILVWIPIPDVLGMRMGIASVSTIFLVLAYLYFKHYRPDMPRPWSIPGGFWFGFIFTLPCIVLSLLNIFLGFVLEDEEPVLWKFSAKVLFLFSVVSVGLAVHGIHIMFADRRYRIVQTSQKPE
eukprot:c22012_g5_i5.p1 GENE.c22012_g5_i5~~c22012_g5_i5.p1  ORF type:complete len:262 (+),score=92.16 c22012_g5_i5:564-1349(+)